MSEYYYFTINEVSLNANFSVKGGKGINGSRYFKGFKRDFNTFFSNAFLLHSDLYCIYFQLIVKSPKLALSHQMLAYFFQAKRLNAFK